MNILNRSKNAFRGVFRFPAVALAIIAIFAANGFSSQSVEQTAQPAYTSVMGAVEGLFQAVQTGNPERIANVLGGPEELLSSQDEMQDQADRDLFLQKYQEMHRLVRGPDGSMTLYIGAENWPFPFPLVEKDGSWRFDPDKGRDEILFRRIGENELAAIETSREFVDARKAGPGADAPIMLDGYYFRLVRGGKPDKSFLLIAYPVEYQSSGVMTFVVTQDGVVYERDLGWNTSTIASVIDVFHKDSAWQPVDE